MNAKPDTSAWTDPDDAPELTAEFFETAEIREGDRVIRVGRGRPKAAETREAVSFRIDRDTLACLRASGPGWQSRVNDVLRAVVIGDETPQLAMERALRQAVEDREAQHRTQLEHLRRQLQNLAATILT